MLRIYGSFLEWFVLLGRELQAKLEGLFCRKFGFHCFLDVVLSRKGRVRLENHIVAIGCGEVALLVPFACFSQHSAFMTP